MALPCVRLGAGRLYSGAVLRFLCRSSSQQAASAAEEIEIPRKKTWDKTAVLKALSYTVNHDPTSMPYNFQDDPFLQPKSSTDRIIHSMSKESGRNAAKYIVNMYPNLFSKDYGVPHIPCLMPDNVEAQIEGISEEALNERIQLRRVKESVDLYDQLLQAGTVPSLETANRLLDLLCFYGDSEPASEIETNLDPEIENTNGEKTLESQSKKSWRVNNNAERIFNLMPEKDEHSFRAMIRGMAKHGAEQKAFDMYTDLLNNRLTGDVHTFNSLIRAAHRVKRDGKERWALIMDLLNHMKSQNVQPNLFTFNTILKCLFKTGLRGMALETFNEMIALNIEPSLATFRHLMQVFIKLGDSSRPAGILKDILQHIEGKSFTMQDPDDVNFFADSMRVCAEAMDLELAYKVEALKNTEDNWKLLGNSNLQTFYYGKLFHLICTLENLDVVLQWYRENVPSKYFPNSKGILELLQVVEMENRLEVLPKLWKDLFLIGHTNKSNVLEEFLQILKKAKPNAELQEEFANIASSMLSLYKNAEITASRLKVTAIALEDIAILLSRSGRMEKVTKTLEFLKSQNLVPQPDVIKELLDAAKTSGNTSMAIDLVQIAAGYSLPNTDKLAKTVLDMSTLKEEQRITLEDLIKKSGSSSSSSSSSSDSDQETV